jgi:hypothetical protein
MNESTWPVNQRVLLDLTFSSRLMETLRKLDNFINGRFVSAGNYLDNINPTTEQVYCQIADSSSDDAHEAVKAAQQAFAG